MLTSLT